MKKKITALILAAAMVASIFAGCGSGPAPGESSSQNIGVGAGETQMCIRDRVKTAQVLHKFCVPVRGNAGAGGCARPPALPGIRIILKIRRLST